MERPDIYFAYGSNMSRARLAARIPAARSLGRAQLPGMQLTTNKRGKDGSGKANLVATRDAVVWGVHYALPREHWSALDRFEWGYRRTTCKLLVDSGTTVVAQVYVAVAPEPNALLAFEWYREHLVIGAREHALPADYRDSLAVLPARPDPNRRG